MCAPAMTADEYFDGRPPAFRRVYDAVIAHLERVGPIAVDVVEVGVLIKRARTFAELRPRRDRFVLSVLLSRAVEHPRIRRTVRRAQTGDRAAHFIDLRDEGDVDDEVRGWLAEAYLSSPE
jgi:hypothetical protein